MIKHCSAFVSIMALASACTSPIINDAVSKFKSGTASAVSIIQNDANSVLAAERYILAGGQALTPDVILNRYKPTERDTLENFKVYVCLQSLKFAGLSDSANLLNGLQLPVKSDDAATTAKAKANLNQKTTDCMNAVQAYVLLEPKDLPLPLNSFSPELGGAGFPVAVVIPFVVLAATLIGDVMGGISTISTAVSAEVLAGQIKASVTNKETQEKVVTALKNLSAPDSDLAKWCPDHAEICAGLKSDTAGTANALGGGSYSIPLDTTDFSNICSVVTDQPRSKTAAAATPTYAIVSNATIYRRWLALRVAYSSYLDYVNFLKSASKPTSFTAAFGNRRQALDAAISAYQTVPGSEDIVTQQAAAWANLTAASCGKLSMDQLYTALSTFATNMTSIFTGAGKASDAITTYNKAVPTEDSL